MFNNFLNCSSITKQIDEDAFQKSHSYLFHMIEPVSVQLMWQRGEAFAHHN